MNKNNEKWFCEFYSPGSGFQMKVNEHLAHEKSPFQVIDMYRTEDFGIVMALDDMVMVTERNEYAYHEMLIHVPLLAHPNPKQVLVVGGGDCGSLREIIKHPSVERAVQVEIDPVVVELSKKYYNWVNPTLANSKVELIIGDALDYVKSTANKFDVVIVDSSDPIGPAEGLFREPFYRDVFRILNDDGIVSSQLGSPFFHAKEIGELITMYRKIYPIAGLYTTYTPEYPSGLWGLGVASKQIDPTRLSSSERYEAVRESLRYYNPRVHHAAFVLPEYIRQQIG